MPERNKYWLAARKSGLGGSDMAAVMGVAKGSRSSEITVYEDKLRPVEDDPEPDEGLAEIFRTCSDQEPYVAKRFSEANGGVQVVRGVELAELCTRRVAQRSVHHIEYDDIALMRQIEELSTIEVYGDTVILRSRERPWQYVSPDGFYYDNGEWCALEIKCVGAYMLKDWDGGTVPEYYMPQLQQLMDLSGCKRGSFAVLIGGQKFGYVYSERDDAMITEMHEKGAALWARIQACDPPDADGSESASKTLARMNPHHDDETVHIEDNGLDDAYAQACADEKDAAKRKKAAANLIKQAIGKHAGAAFSNGVGYTWHANARGVRSLSRKVPK